MGRETQKKKRIKTKKEKGETYKISTRKRIKEEQHKLFVPRWEMGATGMVEPGRVCRFGILSTPSLKEYVQQRVASQATHPPNFSTQEEQHAHTFFSF
jgi:hypothetical protein